MSERVDVATRMRALADAPWVARGDAATVAALREGTDEVERLAALARGAQYREREALAVVAMLRARIDGVGDAGDLALGALRDIGAGAHVVRCLRAPACGDVAADPCAACRAASVVRCLRREVALLSAATERTEGTAGDLAGLARREAGPVTRRQWRACARCGQCFWLADDEAVPGHGVRDAWGADRACGAVVTSEGSEGR